MDTNTVRGSLHPVTGSVSDKAYNNITNVGVICV